MRVPARFMKDTLTVHSVTQAPSDPNTGAGGVDVLTLLLTQSCSLQEVRRNPDGTIAPVSGVQSDIPAFRCYTAYFAQPSGEVVYAVNGTRYPLARFVDVGGQREQVELHLGTPGGTP